MSISCSKATTRLDALARLKEDFLSYLKKASTGAKTPAEAMDALIQAQQFKTDLETGMIELYRELVLEVVVPNALNPYAEALKEAGLPVDHPECAEQKEIMFNLEEIIQSYSDCYTAKGMTEWVTDIQNNQALLEAHLSTPEEMKKIEKRVQAGMVPILMPGRQTQMDTWQKAFEKLTPVWIDNGVEKSFVAAYQHEKYREKMTPPPNPDGTKPATFFDSLSDRPYLVWTKPTAEPTSETTSLTYEEQKAKLVTMYSEDSELVDVVDCTPLEYTALQSTYTNHIRRHASGYVIDIKNITPFDKAGYTRFLSAGPFSDGDVPFAYFSPVNSLLRFNRGAVGADSEFGFRPAARS